MPEDTPVLSPDQQMAELLDKLAGHPTFRRLRGTWGSSLHDLLAERRKDVTSARGAREDVRTWASDLAWAQGLLQQLTLKGHHVAAAELERALLSPEHLLMGEQPDLHQIARCVLIIPRPDIVLPLLQWLHHPERGADDLAPAFEGVQEGAIGHLAAFLAAFDGKAELWWNPKAPLNDTFNLERLASKARLYADGLMARFSARKEEPPPQQVSQLRLQLRSTPHSEAAVLVGAPVWIAWTTQDNLLSYFSRDEQNQVATWQFELPAYRQYRARRRFGLHLEDQHELWRTRYPTYASKSCQRGLGAVAMPYHELVGYDDIDTGNILIG